MRKSVLSVLFAFVVILLFSSNTYAAGGINVKILYPKAVGPVPVDTNFVVGAVVNSLSEIKTVKAKVGSKEILLQKVCQPANDCVWTGEFSLEGLEKGNKTLVVEATNQNNQSAQATSAIKYDSSPVVTIEGPEDSSVIMSNSLRIVVNATDDFSVPEIKVTVSSFSDEGIVSTGSGVLDHTFDVSKYAGQIVRVHIEASDGNYVDGKLVQRFDKYVHLLAEISDRLKKVDQAAGQIMDFDENRLLYLVYNSNNSGLYIKNRSTGDITLVDSLSGPKYFDQAKLTSTGAAFLISNHEDNQTRLFTWKNNKLTDAGIGTQLSDICCKLQVKGDYVFYPNIRINAVTDEIIQTLGSQTDLAANGEYVYVNKPAGSWRSYIYRHRSDGQEETVVQDTNSWDIRLPKWDGNVVVYWGDGSVFKKENGVITELSHNTSGNYAINQGWIAFTKGLPGQTQQIYLQSPEGLVTQATYNLINTPGIENLSTDGTVSFIQNNQLYLQTPLDEPPIYLGSAIGKTKVINGKWFKAISTVLFEIKLAPGNSTPPAWPAPNVLTAADVTGQSARLQWQPATDDVGVTAYNIYQNSSLLNTVSGDVYSYSVSGLTPNTTYSFEVEAVDAAGNKSTVKPATSVTTLPVSTGDTVAPVWPAGTQLTVTDVTYSSAKLQWPLASDNVGVSQYQILRNSEHIDTVTGTVYSYQAAGLAPQTTYVFSVVALDAAGNASTGNPSVSVTTLANVPAQTTGIAFSSASEIAEVGSTIDVQIRANDAKDLYAFLLKLQYDTSRLKLTKIAYISEFGTENGTAVFGKDNQAAAGLLKLTGVRLGAVPGKNGSIGLTTLSFTALKNGETALTLQPESAVTDSKGKQQNLASASFYIAIGGGDFDHDGKVGLSDLFLISQKNGLKKGQPGYDEQFDLKPDGIIDSKDVQYVANKAAKG
ncbi:fibronectin type III domain-containing protein [Paenibacillus sedimenti]|uniref:Fibronectin type III domain-containing protein n=1 Tax=Paenibacillus sedimenti TaxID=2770274 RepID=A0A926QIR0_9BACL|nr:fibronectin type III domain-containing protein [Paenibacillus sedimenti]MBD0379764.1 fibronectin type III domain-containing protein [Paenibacillus sedimenti]